MTGSKAPERSEWLDVLRALAVVLVVLRHGVFVPGFSPPDSSWALPFYVFAANGWLGVDLFFVLSGFLLSTQILRNLEISGVFDRRRFLVRRALRTLPAYVFVVLLLWTGLLSESLETRGVGDLQVLLVHLVFLNDYLGSELMVTLWSLATEEKFYLLMAFAVPVLWRGGFVALITCVAVTFVVVIAARTVTAQASPADSYIEYFWTYRAPFHFAVDGLVLGVLVGAIAVRVRRRPLVGRWVTGVTMMLLLLLVTTREWAGEGNAMLALFAVPSFVVLAAVLVLAAPTMDVGLRSCVCAPVWRFLSRISYTVYLAHYPVAQLTSRWLGPLDGGWLPLTTYWTCYLVGSLLVGWLLHVLIERPGLRWRDRLSARGSA